MHYADPTTLRQIVGTLSENDPTEMISPMHPRRTTFWFTAGPPGRPADCRKLSDLMWRENGNTTTNRSMIIDAISGPALGEHRVPSTVERARAPRGRRGEDLGVARLRGRAG